MHVNVVAPERAFLLVVDLQEAYRKVLHEWDRTLARAGVLVRAARALGLPLLYTEQHPKGLGSTAPELRDPLGDAPRFEKRTLSALGAPGLRAHLAGLGRDVAIVCGIETHACIDQTVHELLADGMQVHLAVDALGSRRPFEHEQALAKMLRSGALPGSVEQIALECLRSADHPAFKSVQALLK
jgi:nicotinamidase-related amidase